jgi:hypothetical protein
MKKPHIESSFIIYVLKCQAAGHKVSMHPKVPATGQVDQDFPWFPKSQNNDELYAIFTLYCLLHIRSSQR